MRNDLVIPTPPPSIIRRILQALGFVSVWMVIFLTPAASAGTRLSIDNASRRLRIEVDVDAAKVIELTSEDILPIRWERNGLRTALLPAILVRDARDLVIVDDAQVAHAVAYNTSLERVRIVPTFRAEVGTWHGQPSNLERRRIFIASLLFSLGLLLVLLVRKNAFPLALLYCSLWIVAILIYGWKRPPIAVAEGWESSAFVPYFARSDQTLRIEVKEGSRCIPVVESLEHLHSFNPRIEVQGDRAWLVIEMKKNAVVGLMRDTGK